MCFTSLKVKLLPSALFIGDKLFLKKKKLNIYLYKKIHLSTNFLNKYIYLYLFVAVLMLWKQQEKSKTLQRKKRIILLIHNLRNFYIFRFFFFLGDLSCLAIEAHVLLNGLLVLYDDCWYKCFRIGLVFFLVWF